MSRSPLKPNTKLSDMLAKVKDRPPMTKVEIAIQRKSWVVGEMMLSHLDMTREEAERIYDKVTE